MKYLLTIFTLIAINANAAGPVGSAIAPPTLVGHFEVKGDIGWVSDNYKNRYPIAMPFAASAICNRNVSTGSRAAEYADFKYIYANLDNNSKYFVMDPFTARTDLASKTYLTKTGVRMVLTQPQDELFCKNYTSSSSSDVTFVINTSTHGLESVACDQTIKVACVKD